jgi:AcrR family transcriptional regulator
MDGAPDNGGRARAASRAAGTASRLGSRERILAAAAHVMGTEGVRSLTTRRVAREAGVNLGLLHYYFSSMDEMRLEVLRDFVLRLGSSAAIIDEEAEDPLESLVAALSKALGESLESPGLLLSLIALLLESARERAPLAAGASGASGPEGAAADSPVGTLIAVQRGLAARIERMVLRALQLVASIFHPMILVDFPRTVFGLDLRDETARKAYVRQAVETALAPLAYTRTP